MLPSSLRCMWRAGEQIQECPQGEKLFPSETAKSKTSMWEAVKHRRSTEDGVTRKWNSWKGIQWAKTKFPAGRMFPRNCVTAGWTQRGYNAQHFISPAARNPASQRGAIDGAGVDKSREEDTMLSSQSAQDSIVHSSWTDDMLNGRSCSTEDYDRHHWGLYERKPL
jgi:hypothetical protein